MQQPSIDNHDRHGANPGLPEGEGGAMMLERMNAGDHERLANWGLALMRLDSKSTMIDIGCGGGANLARLLSLAPNGHVVGIDHASLSVETSLAYNAEAVQAGQCEVLQGDVRTLPFADNFFDAATAFETVYFWPDIAQSLAEVYRVLAPGGCFLICNEADGSQPEVHEFAKTIENMSVYTNDELCDLLTRAGFIVEVAESEPDEHWARILAKK